MLLASKKRDHINTVRLLRVLRDKRLSPGEKDHLIRKSPELREASDSFCVQCGTCCPLMCTAREYNLYDGKVYCRVHNGTGEPGSYPIRDPDPSRLSKPDTCREAGPGSFFLVMEKLERDGEPTIPCYREIKKAMAKYREHLADLG